MYLIRLDDASDYMDIEKWDKLERLLSQYNIKPIVGIIPKNQDIALVGRYKRNPDFWNKVKTWEAKKWAIALHGYTHERLSNHGGINPVNSISEFAGLPLDTQRKQIRQGIKILTDNQIEPKIFFAPFHTFDMNTLEALKLESKIRIISDTVANDIYKMDEFYFIPQQSGHAQSLPFKTTTFCYHPNTMNEKNFAMLKTFFAKNKEKFVAFNDLILKDRKLTIYDLVLKLLITMKRKTAIWQKQ